MKRLYKAFKFSLDGLTSCYKYEPSFRLEVWIMVFAIPAAFYFGQSKLEVIALLGSAGFVLVVELLNSSVENVANRIGMEYHDLIKNAKDQGSAAVMLSCAFTLFTWIYIICF